MVVDLYPFVLFLPIDRKNKILKAIFGSKSAVEILNYALLQGISNKIHQQHLIRNLSYSNKTVIENLKSLTKLGVLFENMEKVKREGRTLWVKTYQLSDVGKWFALLLAEDKDLSTKEKREILQNIFTRYVKWVKNLSENLQVSKGWLEKMFKEAMK